MMMTSDLKPGLCVRLISFGASDNYYRRKLLSLGITRGVDVRVIRVAPLGCPLQIEVRGAAIILRFDEARYLQWERI